MTKRIKWIDFGKGFTIFLVVLGHVLSGIYSHGLYPTYRDELMIFSDLIFLIIMPIFFSLSGYLYKSPYTWNGFFKMMKKKAANLLIPYVVFSVIYVFLENATNSHGSIKHVISWQTLLYIGIKPIGYLWFLFALFFIFLIVGIFDIYKIGYFVQLLIYLLLFSVSQFVHLPIGINYIFNWIFFFYLGVIYKRYVNVIDRKYIYVFSLIIFIVSVGAVFKLSGISSNYNSPNLINFIPKVLSVYLFFKLFSILPHGDFFKYFQHKGKYSLIIYLVHLPLISIVRVILFHIYTPNVLLAIILLTIVGWYGSLIAVWFSNKFKCINVIFNPYYYISRITK